MLSAKDLLARARAQNQSSTYEAAKTEPLAPQQGAQTSIGSLAKTGVSFDNLLNSAKAAAGAQAGRDKFDIMSDPKAAAHSAVKAKIEMIDGLIKADNPGLARVIVEIRGIVKSQGGLEYELTPEEIGAISRGLYKAKGIMMAAKASGKKGARASSVSSADLANVLGDLKL